MALVKSRIDELENVDRVQLRWWDLFIPFIGIFAFIFLTTLVYIPMYRDVVEMRNEISNLRDEQGKLQDNISRANELEDIKGILNNDLHNVELVIPNSLEVSDFAFYVDQHAQDNGLELRSIASSDISFGEVEDKVYSSGVVKGVTGPLSYVGSFDQIVSFLEHLKIESPYIIDTTDVGIRIVGDTAWAVDLGITGYYLVEFEEIDFNPTSRVHLYIDEEDALKVLEEKSNQISLEGE